MEKFRFDQLLRIKTQFEEIKKNELAKQNQILNEYIEKKLELEENIKKAREDLKSLCLNGFFATADESLFPVSQHAKKEDGCSKPVNLLSAN